MKTPIKKRLLSPARSQGAGPRTPIRHRHRRTLSVGSARSNASGKLTALIQQNRNMDSFAVSPLANRKSILSDNTEIEEPKRKSWWKKLGENSRDVTELFEENKNDEPNNIIEELDIEVLSQEKRNYTMDLPESSDSESINSIVIPQRKLFTQKENLPQKKFGQIIGTRETLAKLHKTNTDVDKSIKVVTRELFQNNQRSKPIFPAALLNISPNKTAADKTKEFATVEPKAQVRNIFGNRATKRKNIFTNFIVSESEDEIPEIQPKVFGFQKKIEARRRGSSSSRGLREPSPTSSITTDIEMDDWKMLPSSTMVEHQIEVMMADGNSPKRTRLSKLTEIESEGSSNATKQSNKSVQSKDKTRKSKTFTKEKGPEPNSIAEEIFGQDEESTNKTRKSKTFTKEKAAESSMTTRNKSKAQDDDDLEQDQIVQNKSSKDTDKSRKSKTFTKEKVPETETMDPRNKTRVSQNDVEDIFNQEEQKDTDKSRKSKTFTKDKGRDLETSMRNKSTGSHKEEVIETQTAQNKSKSKIAELNISQSSIKTRSQSKTNSPNNSQIINDKVTKNVEIININKSKKISVSPKNIETKTPSDVAEENDDEELNFTLEYETEEIPETIPNISNIKARTSKSMTHQDNSSNISKTNKTMPNKVIDESAEQESTQEKSIQSAKDDSKVEGDMELNDKQTEQCHALENEDNEIANELHKSIENQIVDAQDKSCEEMDQQEENEESKKNDESENQNESQVENNDESEIEKSQEQEQNIEISIVEEDVEIASENEDEPDNVSQETENNNESQEVEDENESHDEIQNESDVQNASQEVDEERDEEHSIRQEVDENEEDDEQNISQEVNAVDQNISEDEQNKSEVQNESQEVDDEENEEEDEEQNISQEEDENEKDERNISLQVDENEEEDEGQNKSEEVDEEQIESEVDQESEANADSDNDDELNNQDANDSHNNEETENDQEVIESGTDEMETPNVSHDTTGRNRKKNESPEVILHDSNDHLDSFAVRGRNTSVRKTEMIKTLNIRSSLAPVRESTGFSDGSKNSSAEGSGWDSHRTTRKTLRQTFGRDFTPRKSLRALVMEKSAKRQTQHNDLASVTAKFPQANSTELPEMSNRFDDDQDENQEPNHEVSLRTRQTTLERYLQEIKKKNTETRLKMEEAVRNSLNAPSKDHIFKVPAKPLFARRQTKSTAKPKQTKSTLFLGELPAEVIEDLKYKPPKRFQPSNAPWITKRLYKFLESKLEAKYDYKARVRAEKLVEHIYHFAKDLRRHETAASDSVDVLKREMARLDVVKTHFEFYEFFHQFMPREVRVKVVPDVVNKISLPRHGVFSDIL